MRSSSVDSFSSCRTGCTSATATGKAAAPGPTGYVPIAGVAQMAEDQAALVDDRDFTVPEYDTKAAQPGLSDATLEQGSGAQVAVSIRGLAIGAAVLMLVLVVVIIVQQGGGGPTTETESGVGPTTETILYLGDPQIGMGNSGFLMDKLRFAAAAAVAEGMTAVVVAGDVTNDWTDDRFAAAASEAGPVTSAMRHGFAGLRLR